MASFFSHSSIAGNLDFHILVHGLFLYVSLKSLIYSSDTGDLDVEIFLRKDSVVGTRILMRGGSSVWS